MYYRLLSIPQAQLDDVIRAILQRNDSVFLDSSGHKSDNAQWSVVAWQPLSVITSSLFDSEIRDQFGNKSVSQECPIALIDGELHQANIGTLPFAFFGGAIGYWDYELGGRFESLPTPKDNQITLPKMFVGIYDTLLFIDHQQNQTHFICHRSDAEQQYNALLELESIETHAFKLRSRWQSNMTRAEYQTKFDRIQDYLKAGDCYQINLAQRFSAEYDGDEWQAYQKLREQNSAPFSAFIRTEHGVVMSVSPERFLQVKDGAIETKPIKGTRPRSLDPVIDQALATELANSSKDQAENLMIVDLLRNDVSKVARPGTVNVTKLFDIESYPAVHHLVSTVVAQLDVNKTALDLLKGAFPGGSITGAPKIRAMQIIHELEPSPRSVYCGAIGYIKPNGDMDTNIAIRTLVCNQNKIHCWAGGGIVLDSNVDSEYQETLDKVGKILPILETQS